MGRFRCLSQPVRQASQRAIEQAIEYIIITYFGNNKAPRVADKTKGGVLSVLINLLSHFINFACTGNEYGKSCLTPFDQTCQLVVSHY
jgi:hypothetical protein